MEEKKKGGISESALKYVILMTMFMDHFAAAILDKILVGYGIEEAQSLEEIYVIFDNHSMAIVISGVGLLLRIIGRLAFPLVCFTLVEGFLHTTNRKKYIFRMLGLAVISEIPYDLARKQQLFDFSTQNTIITLLIALLCLCVIEKIQEYCAGGKKILRNVYILLVILAGCFLAVFVRSDYGVYGFLAIIFMYLLRNRRMWGNVLGIVVLCLGSLIEVFAFFDLILISKYNGTRGNANKWLFYIFYPAHLLLLGVIATRI